MRCAVSVDPGEFMPQLDIDPSSNRPAYARWLRHSNDITQQFLAIGGMADFISLGGGLPAAELYPLKAIQSATERALSHWGTQALEYGPVEGLPALRDAIAQRMSKRLKGRFTSDNVIITSGAMQSLEIIGKVLIDRGDCVVTQHPTYVGALDAWRAREPTYVPLDWRDRQGTLCSDLRQSKFVYAVPNYSNPTGVLVPTSERVHLLACAARAGVWVLEDDPYCALHYDGPAEPALMTLDCAGLGGGAYAGPVIYLGTLSKSIAPGLRVGWALADASMIRMLTLAKMASDLSGSMFSQAVAWQLLQDDIESSHCVRIVSAYRERRDALCAQARAELSEWFEWEVPPGGMFVWMRARDPRIDTDVLYRFAKEEKVAFVPSSVFYHAGQLNNAMRLNFTRGAPAQLREGVSRLARAVRRYLNNHA